MLCTSLDSGVGRMRSQEVRKRRVDFFPTSILFKNVESEKDCGLLASTTCVNQDAHVVKNRMPLMKNMIVSYSGN